MTLWLYIKTTWNYWSWDPKLGKGSWRRLDLFQKEHTQGGIWIPLGSSGCPIIALYHHETPGLCRWRRCWRRHGRCHGRRCWSSRRCRHGMRRRHRHRHRRDANFLRGLVHLKVQFAWQVSYVKPCHLTWAGFLKGRVKRTLQQNVLMNNPYEANSTTY